MADELDRPDSVDQLYIERGDPVPPWRPVLTGDIVRGLSIPGLDETELTMIISHPCTMRGRGEGLRDRLEAVPVRPYREVPFDRWPSGYLKVYPLPGLGEPIAARLDELGMVRSEALDLGRRIACLSEDGITLLLQRLFACFARVKVELSTIAQKLDGPFNEAELIEEWNEALVAEPVENGSQLDEALASQEADFDTFLTEHGVEGRLRQEALRDPSTAARVRREVRAEIRRRLEVLPSRSGARRRSRRAGPG